MTSSFSHSFLLSVLFILSICCLSALGAEQLLSVNVRDWEHVLGKRDRRDTSFADLALKNTTQMIWGKNGFHANMILHAQDGRDIVLLENFDGLTKSVDCDGSDGSISLTFNSKPAFEQALKYWAFINENEDQDFLLIANHKGCGPDNQRQPYVYDIYQQYFVHSEHC